MIRLRLSRRARIRIYDEHNGYCHLCGLHIKAESGEKWDLDHVIPLHLGGSSKEWNLAPAHKACHAKKNGGENPIRSKTDRQRANYLGVKKSGPKLPGGRDSAISKTIRGAVVIRQSQSDKHKAAMAKRYGENQ